MNHWLNPPKLELQSQGAVSFNLKACNYCDFQVIRLVKLHLWNHELPEGIFVRLLTNTTPFSWSLARAHLDFKRCRRHFMKAASSLSCKGLFSSLPLPRHLLLQH